jgi:hypothetical protein
VILLLLSLLACSGSSVVIGDETGLSGEGTDQDRDGYLASVDCDDADASVHPGAEEVWYDGVDQDCDDSDDDQDGDTYPASTDCDDTDPSVHPTAGEVPDDGIDQDCDGSDSTGGGSATDGDGDGYLDTVDCDDADAAVNPGADDVPDDGIDQDCDGSDAAGGVGDDADGDGYKASVDRDETDPAIHPGAVDTAGDGIDQDCDGADDAPSADADADGWAAESFGGPDCDDTDAAVNPDAVERVGDGVDSDCDGADYGVDGLAAGDLVITEIMYDPDAVSDTDGEWFEVYNGTGDSVNLLGLVVADDSAYSAADLFTVETDLVAAAGERLVFVVSGDTTINGGITADYDFAGGGVNLNNSGDQVYVGVPAGAGRYTTIDSVSYDETAGWPLAKGYSIELNDTKVTSSDNDTASNWCLPTSTAGSNSDRGSPGAVSSGC